MTKKKLVVGLLAIMLVPTAVMADEMISLDKVKNFFSSNSDKKDDIPQGMKNDLPQKTVQGGSSVLNLPPFPDGAGAAPAAAPDGIFGTAPVATGTNPGLVTKSKVVTSKASRLSCPDLAADMNDGNAKVASALERLNGNVQQYHRAKADVQTISDYQQKLSMDPVYNSQPALMNEVAARVSGANGAMLKFRNDAFQVYNVLLTRDGTVRKYLKAHGGELKACGFAPYYEQAGYVDQAKNLINSVQ